MNIIDSLVVELSLDGSQFEKGQRDALEAFKKTREGVKAFADSIQEEGQRLSQIFSIVKGGAVGILGVFGAEEIGSFIDGVARMDAATFQMAHTIGMNTERLAEWEGMVRMAGGTAGEADATIGALQDTMTSFAMGAGLLPAPLAALFGRAGVGRGETADVALQKISEYLFQEREAGRMTPQAQRWWLEQAGVHGHMLYLLMQGKRAMDEWADSLRRAGLASEASGAAAVDYQKKAALLDLAIQHLARVSFPWLTSIITRLADLIGYTENKQDEAALRAHGLRELQGRQPSLAGRFMSWLGGWREGTAQLPGGWQAAGGESRGDRNNNPGNIKYGDFARAHGAVGQDAGGFAVFPSQDAGQRAMWDLLAGSYFGLTLSQIQRKWAPGAAPSYLQSMMAATGLGAGDVPNLMDPSMIAKLMLGMTRGEGTHLRAPPGAAAAASHVTHHKGGDRTSSISIGSMNISSANADPRRVAVAVLDEAGRRIKTAMPMDTGLA